MSTQQQRMVEFYAFLRPFLREEEANTAWLEQDPGGRPFAELLPEIPERFGIGPGHTLVDVGAGTARIACKLATRLRCSVVAVDPLPEHIELARTRVHDEGLATTVTPVLGSIEQLPVATASADFVWCHDMFNHVGDIDRAASECARILRPGGIMLDYSILATERLQPGEIADFAEPLGINPETLSEARMTGAFTAAGLRLRELGRTNDESSPFFEALDEHGGRDAMRLARILRARTQTIARLGPDDYARLVGYYLWNLNLLIDKLTYGVWIFERDPAPPDLHAGDRP